MVERSGFAVLRLGLELPHDLAERVASLSAPLRPEGLLTGTADASDIVKVWRATSRHQDIQDHLAWVVLLEAIRHALESQPASASDALAAYQMHPARTVAEVNIQLGSRLYHLAWHRLETDPAGSRQLFQKSIAAFDRAVETGARVPTPTQRGLKGMRGVARVLLARGDDEPVELLSEAVRDLEAAERHGDMSAAHFGFLAEVHLRLYRFQGGAHLDLALAAFRRAERLGHRTRTLQLALSEALARRAFDSLGREPTKSAAQLFEDAATECTAALELPDEKHRQPDEVVLTRRGQWRFQQALLQQDEAQRGELLDEAISDLRGSRIPGNSLPRALVARAEAARERGDWASAHADFDEAQTYIERTGVGDEPLMRHVETLVERSAIWAALDGGTGADALPSIRRMLDASDRAGVSLAAIGHGLRGAEPFLGPDELRDLCARAAGVARREVDDIRLTREARVFAASQGAGLLWAVARVRDDPELLRLACALYRDGITLAAETAAVEMLSNAGECALRLARVISSRSETDHDEAVDLLVEAHAHLGGAISARDLSSDTSSPNRAVMLSMLGEVLGRRYVLTHHAPDAHAAIAALSAARASGGDTRRIEDLLANVYYRRGRNTGSEEDFLTAIELKQSAARQAPATKETWSVCAAAELGLHDLDGDDEHLVVAASYSEDARRLDPSWPWPVLQLATVAARIRATNRTWAPGRTTSPIEMALNGDAEELLRLAAKLAVETTGLGKRVLGGRQEVFVLADPHNLLAQTLVLKATPRVNAEREMREALAIAEFITAHGDSAMRVPTPLAIVDQRAGPPVYVMRRASGRDLGRIISDYREGTSPMPARECKLALRFLALFHAYSLGSARRLETWSTGDRRTAAFKHAKSLIMLGAKRDAVHSARNAFRNALPAGLPVLAKKDAHPGNWLVDESGRVVMLDLEASTSLPILAEVVQLLDDYPLFNVSEEGFDERLEFADHYMHSLHETGPTIPLPESPRLLYEVFALQRAVFGLASSPSRLRHAHSVSAVRRTRAQEEHYRKLWQWLAEMALDPVRAAAVEALVAIQS